MSKSEHDAAMREVLRILEQRKLLATEELISLLVEAFGAGSSWQSGQRAEVVDSKVRRFFRSGLCGKHKN